MSILDESGCNLDYYLYMVLGGEWPKTKRFGPFHEESEFFQSDMIGIIEAKYHFYHMSMSPQCYCDV